MKKIPTVFRRNPDDLRYVVPDVTPGCEWVLAGEGRGLRKYDGTCVMFDGVRWFARREVKEGKRPPDNFLPLSTDSVTGKTMGWEPIEQSGFAKWHAEALARMPANRWDVGTYELCGPKVQGNPEDFDEHRLVSHTDAEVVLGPGGRPGGTYTFEDLSLIVRAYGYGDIGREGIVWWHPDGRRAKLKVRDYPEPTT